MRETNISITVPNRYASQLALPALLYISGMISAAVIVGDISAIAIAVTPVNPRQLARNPVSVSLFSIELFSSRPTEHSPRSHRRQSQKTGSRAGALLQAICP